MGLNDLIKDLIEEKNYVWRPHSSWFEIIERSGTQLNLERLIGAVKELVERTLKFEN
jgi:hypothetical protein